MDSLRLLLNVVRLGLFACVAVVVWYAANRDSLDALSDAYRERQFYQTQLARLRVTIESMYGERNELVRGGYPAEKALREQLLYANEGEYVYRLHYAEAVEAEPLGRSARERWAERGRGAAGDDRAN